MATEKKVSVATWRLPKLISDPDIKEDLFYLQGFTFCKLFGIHDRKVISKKMSSYASERGHRNTLSKISKYFPSTNFEKMETWAFLEIFLAEIYFTAS